MNSKELDLHGMSHTCAAQAVEEFIMLNDLPISIITGNSVKMKKVVREILERNNLTAYYLNPNNLGKLLVCKEKLD